MSDHKMTLQPELERPVLPVFEAPGLAPAVGESAPAIGRDMGHDAIHQFSDLADIPLRDWSQLVERAVEPNAFYEPAWARMVSAHARGRMSAKALLTWETPQRKRLIGLMPVASAWRTLKLPIPVLVAWQAYAPLTTPLLDRDAAEQAAAGLLDAAGYAAAQA